MCFGQDKHVDEAARSGEPQYMNNAPLTVFHAAAQRAASVFKTAIRHGVQRFRRELVREMARDVETIVSTYRRLWAGELDVLEVYRALRTEGGYRVVKGSLRVVQA